MKRLVYQNNVEYELYIGYSQFGEIIDITDKSIKITTVEPREKSEDFIKKFVKAIPGSQGYVMEGLLDSTVIGITIDHPSYSFRMENARLYVVKRTNNWELS